MKFKYPINKISNGIIVLVLLNISFINSSFAKDTECEFKTIEILAQKITSKYPQRKLSTLDSKKPYINTIQVVIDHSITGEFEVEVVSSFKGIEKWLTSLEPEPGFPDRKTRPLLWCKKGLCVFDFNEGLMHNTLFPQKLIYEYKEGCPYIKTIFFVHGD